MRACTVGDKLGGGAWVRGNCIIALHRYPCCHYYCNRYTHEHWLRTRNEVCDEEHLYSSTTLQTYLVQSFREIISLIGVPRVQGYLYLILFSQPRIIAVLLITETPFDKIFENPSRWGGTTSKCKAPGRLLLSGRVGLLYLFFLAFKCAWMHPSPARRSAGKYGIYTAAYIKSEVRRDI